MVEVCICFCPPVSFHVHLLLGFCAFTITALTIIIAFAIIDSPSPHSPSSRCIALVTSPPPPYQPQALAAPPVVKREAQRSAPLTADERGQMLGEAPLAQHQPAEELPPPPDRKVPLMKIADADRQRIRQALGGSFVRWGL